MPGLEQEVQHGLLRNPLGQREGGGEEKQSLYLGMLHHRFFQRAPPLDHVGKVHQSPVGQAQRQVQIAKPHIHVDTQGGMAQGGQTGTYSADQGGLSRPPFAGGDSDHSSHIQITSQITLLYHGKWGGSTLFLCNSVKYFPILAYRGVFLIFPQLRGKPLGVGESFFTVTIRWDSPPPGMG